jgi:hypothetical protein
MIDPGLRDTVAVVTGGNSLAGIGSGARTTSRT